MPKLSKKKLFKLAHPFCCFCGGTTPFVNIDHVPPQACFPKGYWPDGFEFPACGACNHGSRKDDCLAGFYTQLLDFGESSKTPEGIARLTKLRDGVFRRWPDALPDISSSVPIQRVGSIWTTTPVAQAVNQPAAFSPAMHTLERKLTHALYYKETSKVISNRHFYLSEHYQEQGSDHTLTTYLAQLFPKGLEAAE